MILNVSSRTDVVAFYTKWFMNRYQEGYVDVRNPFHPKLASRIYFEDVDAIVFCTKNPQPIIAYLRQIDQPILFHITLTPYKKEIEPNVMDKKDVIEAIKKISAIIGIDHVYVRYDPIFLSDQYNLEYHKRAFDRMCSLLDGYVKKIIVSFMDDYKNVRKNRLVLKDRKFTEKDFKEIGIYFSKSAKKHHMSVQTCFEDRNLVEYGFKKDDCISRQFAFQLTNKTYKRWTARKEKKCNCVQMVDIGVYNSCHHLCKYCYANYDETKVKENMKNHDPNSSLLIGKLQEDDIIKIRVTIYSHD